MTQHRNSSARIIEEIRHQNIYLEKTETGVRLLSERGKVSPELRRRVEDNLSAVRDFIEEAQLVPDPTGIPPVAPAAHYPLSSPQKRLWILEQMEKQSTAYLIAFPFEWNFRVDPQAFSAAVSALVHHHEILRTTIQLHEGHPQQFIAEALPPNLIANFRDLTGHPAPQAETIYRAQQAQALATPMSLSTGPLIQFHVFNFAANARILVVVHHIVFDGWSHQILEDHLQRFYERARGEKTDVPAPLPIQYKSYAAWEQQQLTGAAAESHRAYWQQQIAGTPAENAVFPYDFHPAVPRKQGKTIFRILPAATVNRLRELVRHHNATLFMGLTAAIKGLLARYTGEDAPVLGTAESGRSQPELEAMIGFFIRTLPLKTYVDQENDFHQLLQSVRQTVLGAYAHAIYPFEQIVDDHNVAVRPGYNPLFDIMVILQDPEFPIPEGVAQQFAGQEQDNEAKFSLTFDFRLVEDGGLMVALEYKTDLYTSATARQLLTHLDTWLTAATDHPGTPLYALPLVSEAQAKMMRQTFNPPPVELPKASDFPAQFLAQTEQNPDASALWWQGKSITYRELRHHAECIADHVRQTHGEVAPGTRIAVLLDRGPHLVPTLLAVFALGAAYVPIDPAYPPSRQQYMLVDSQAELLIGAPRHTAELEFRGHTVDIHQVDFSRTVREFAWFAPQMDDLAYLIYTSGSTGQPKGVCIAHGNLANLLFWAHTEFPAKVLARMLAATSICFDLSIFEIFLPLYAGQALELVPDILALLESPELPVTFLNTVPSAAREIVYQNAIPPTVRTVALAGEPLPRDLADALYALPHIEAVYNLYAPSETTTYSTFGRVPRESTAPPSVGVPITNTRIYLLDAHRQMVPVGLPGEIYIAGRGVTQGYFNQPELTQERYLADPFAAPGERMYQTGDLGHWQADGQIQVLGRTDNQVKVRGFRVELGSVEVQARTYPGIREAVAVGHKDSLGSTMLVLYVQAQGDPVDPERLRKHLAEKLPAHAVPEFVIALERIPQTPNGKVDKRALPPPDRNALADPAEFVPPSEGLETAIATLWEELLDIAPIGRNAHFFQLGGHSLLATRLMALVHARTGIQLPLTRIFEHPRLGDFTRQINWEGEQALPPIQKVEARPYYPATHAQKRLWLLHQSEANRRAYNLPFRFDVPGPMAYPLVVETVRLLVARHPILRTEFPAHDGEPLQRVLPPEQFALPLQVVDQSSNPQADRFVDELYRTQQQFEFDLEKAPLWQVVIVRLRANVHTVLIVGHHLLADLWSLDLLGQEFRTLYDAVREGQRPQLPTPEIALTDLAVWQEQAPHLEAWKQQRSWWRGKFPSPPEPLALPVEVTGHTGQAVAREVQIWGGPEMEALHRLNPEGEYTTFMLMVGLLSATFFRYSGQEEINLATPISGRENHQLSGLVGYLLNTLLIKTRVAADLSFAQLMKQVQEGVIGDFRNQDYPLDLLVEELGGATADLFRVMLVVLRSEAEPDLTDPDAHPGGDAKSDLLVSVTEFPEQIAVSIEYNRSRFFPETVTTLQDRIRQLLLHAGEHPGAALGDISLLTESDQARLRAFERGPIRNPVEMPEFFVRFAEQVSHQPEAPALRVDGKTLSYAELDREARRMLARITRNSAYRPGSKIAVLVDRNADLLPVLLAIWGAGCTYVPIDPAYPAERIQAIQDDAAASMVIVGNADWETAPGTPRLVLAPGTAPKVRPKRKLVAAPPAAHAYLIYTSGSTGKPKGVCITWANLHNFLAWGSRNYGRSQLQGTLAGTSICFDLSIFELFLPLVQGGTVILVPNVLALASDTPPQGVTLINTVPSAATELVALEAIPATVRTINLAGEPLPASLVDALYQAENVREVFNLYAPSETTTYSTWTLTQPGQPNNPSIGKPLLNTRIYILDEQRRRQPLGMDGEIFIAGAGVSAGYHGQPSLTDERFWADPWVDGEMMYRTGDLGRWNADGSIQLSGRADHQIKLRGFRIELGEIESRLLELEGIEAAVVVGRKEDRRAVELVAYYTGQNAGTPKALETALEKRLPEYMVPRRWQKLAQLPRTPNGKIDRKALPAPPTSARATEGERVAPHTQIQRRIARIWAEVLEREDLGIHQDFFHLGGHSLKAARLVARLNKQLNANLRVDQVFKHPTIAELEVLLDDPGAEPFEAIPQLSPRELYACSHSQRQLWILHHLEENPVAYNISMHFDLQPGFRPELLGQAFAALVEQHEILRTVFVEKDDVPHMRILPFAGFPTAVPVYPLHQHPDPETALDFLRKQDSLQAFDLQRGPLIRCALAVRPDSSMLLLLSIHHIIADGWSLSVLLQDLFRHYNEVVKGEQPTTFSAGIQFKDYAAWEREKLQAGQWDHHRDYWHRQLREPLPVLDLPTDFPRPKVRQPQGAARVFQFEPEWLEPLKAYATERDASLYMLLIAMFHTLFYRYTGETDMIFGTPLAGRDEASLDDKIGFFVRSLPLRNRFSTADTFEKLLGRVRENTLDMYAHQQYPMSLLVEELNINRDPARSLLFDVMVVLQNFNEMLLPEDAGEKTSAQQLDTKYLESKFDLLFSVVEKPDGLLMTVEWNTPLFTEARIEQMIQHFHNLGGALLRQSRARLGQLEIYSPEEMHGLHRQIKAATDSSVDHPLELFIAALEAEPCDPALRVDRFTYTYEDCAAGAAWYTEQLQAAGCQSGNLVVMAEMDPTEAVLAQIGAWKAGAVVLQLPEHLQADLQRYLPHFSTQVFRLGGHSYAASAIKSLPQGRAGQVGVWTDLPATTLPPVATYHLQGDDEGQFTWGPVPAALLTAKMQEDHQQLGAVSGTEVLQTTWRNVPVPFGGICLRLTEAASLNGTDSEASAARLTNGEAILLADELARGGEAPNWKSVLFEGVPPTEEIIAELVAQLPQTQLIFAQGPGILGDGGIYGKADAQGVVHFTQTLPGLEVALLADRGKGGPLPIGIDGSLFIGGDVLKGMRRNVLPSLNRTSQGKMADTGMRARWTGAGTLALTQTETASEWMHGKWESFLVNLARRQESVHEAVVLRSGNCEAIVFVETEGDGTDLERALAYQLPVVLPQPAVYAVAEIPRNSAGAPDTNALAALWERNLTPLEEAIREVWVDILEADDIGLDDRFFAIGGNSIKALRVIARIQQQLNLALDIADIFQYDTLRTLAKLLSQQSPDLAGDQLTSSAFQAEFPASSAQKRMWVLQQLEAESTAYNMQHEITLPPTTPPERLVEAWTALIRRHESLRTRFVIVHGELSQKIQPTEDAQIPLIQLYDLRAQPDPAKTWAEIGGVRRAEPFDLEHESPLRAACAQFADHCVLQITMHHIISDGWSLGVLERDFRALLEHAQHPDAPPPEPLAFQYRDYTQWLTERETPEAMRSHQEYWRECLAGPLPVLELPTDRPRPATRQNQGYAYSFPIGGEPSRQLAQFTQDRDATLFMGLLASVVAFLKRLSRQEEILLGIPQAGRDRPEFEPLIGFFVKTLPLRFLTETETNFEMLLEMARGNFLDGVRHSAYPFEQIVADLNPERNPSRSVLIDVMMVLQNANTAFADDQSTGTVTLHEHLPTDIKFDLVVSFAQIGEELVATFEYDGALFLPESIESWATHFSQFLAGCLAAPNKPVDRIPLTTWDTALAEAEGVYGREVALDASGTVLERVAEQVAQRVDQVYALDDTGTMTYGELESISQRVAIFLQSQQLEPGQPIGVMMHKTARYPAVILGIFKAGLNYVPLAPTNPPERTRLIVEDAGLAVVLCDPDLQSKWENLPVRLLVTAGEWYRKTRRRKLRPPIIQPEDVAYTIYTSGSTGKPKGVLVTHRNLLNFITWTTDTFNPEGQDVGLLAASIGFDLSLHELFTWMCSGGQVVVLDNLLDLGEAVHRDKITSIASVPSAILPLVQLGQLPDKLRTIGLGGEPMPPGLVRTLAELPGIERILNLYGPTETTVMSVTAELNGNLTTHPPIGYPIYNTTALVLDGAGQPLPVGFIGELVLGGAGVSRGYHNRPELNAARFVELAGRRSYFTGDLVHRLPSGALVFHGRIDQQVKIRGQRIELGEIEARLSLHEAVSGACVLAVERGQRGKELVAFISLRRPIEKAQLLTDLEASLPPYMIPTHLEVIETIPFNYSGKADRRALARLVPPPDDLAPDALLLPRTELEAELLVRYRKVLGHEQLGVETDFFAAGGHSLMALRLVSRLNESFQLALTFRDVFQIRTVAEMARQVEAIRWVRAALPQPPDNWGEIIELQLPANSL